MVALSSNSNDLCKFVKAKYGNMVKLYLPYAAQPYLTKM